MIVFRIDDIGASSKLYNQHGRWRIGSFWFLKRIWPFKKWGPYKELTVGEWKDILNVFVEHQVVPILAITAVWVERDSSLTPFPEKFPEQAKFLKQAFLNNKIVIANHGLTHCVVGKHLPRFFSSNRKYHREFWSYLPQSIHTEHIIKSQAILEGFLEKQINIFVPPGNVWSQKTYKALKETNIKKVISNRCMADYAEEMEDIEFINDLDDSIVLHDRDLKLKGKKWLNELLTRNKK